MRTGVCLAQLLELGGPVLLFGLVVAAHTLVLLQLIQDVHLNLPYHT